MGDTELPEISELSDYIQRDRRTYVGSIVSRFSASTTTDGNVIRESASCLFIKITTV